MTHPLPSEHNTQPARTAVQLAFKDELRRLNFNS